MSLVDLVYRGILLLSHNRWPREKVIHQSEARFRKMLTYAYSNSPFYREYYRSHGISEKDLPYVTPSDIPPIDKDHLRSNFYNIAPDPPKPDEVEQALQEADLLSRAGKYFLVHSSGSTGEPANFTGRAVGLPPPPFPR